MNVAGSGARQAPGGNFWSRQVTGCIVFEAFDLVKEISQTCGRSCSPQKYDPSLHSLLHEPIFMMQAAEYGSLHHLVSDRQTVSVQVGRKLVRDGLRHTGA